MALSGHTIAIVVPAYNEEQLICITIETLPAFVDAVIVIDDASTDATAERVINLGDPRVTLIRHDKNTGVGGAVLDGHRRALEDGYDISIVMAGDAQMPPEYLEALLQPIVNGDADFAKGDRFGAGESVAEMPFMRRWGSVLLSVMTKAASGYWHVFDAQNGYTAVHRRALEQLPLDDIALGYPFENSILIHLNIVGARAVDVSIPAKYGAEVSSMRISRAGPAIAWVLFTGYWMRIWRKYMVRRPSLIALLAYAGVGLFTLGVLIGLFATYYSIGVSTASAGTAILAVGAVMLGVQLAIVSMVLDYLDNRPEPRPRP